MLDGPFHEKNRTRRDGLPLVASLKRRPPLENVIHFILRVRTLLVHLPGLQAIESHAKRRLPEKLRPRLSPLSGFTKKCIDVKRLHWVPFQRNTDVPQTLTEKPTN